MLFFETMKLDKRHSSSKAQATYLPPLDGIRGLAIIGVILCHLTVFGPEDIYRDYKFINSVFYAGWSGVDLFFVLSGFLITGILLDHKVSPYYYKSFYIRRILRIFPVYYFALTVIVLAAFFLTHEYITIQNSGLKAELIRSMDHVNNEHLSFCFYLQNWSVFFTGDGPEYLFHFRSLAIEEQFYIIWPLAI